MSVNTTIFSKQASPYTQAEYQTSSPRVKSHLFHFLLSSNQPVDFVVAQIQSTVEKAKSNPVLLNKLTQADASNYSWTPLQIATMQGKVEIVVALLAVKSVRDTINARDSQGWTALHHAAIPSSNAKAIEQALVKAGANKTLTTHSGLIVEAIKNYTNPDLPSKMISYVQFNGVPLTQGMLGQFGMTHFRDDLYFPNPRGLWEQKELDNDSTQNQICANSLDKASKKVNIVPLSTGGYGLKAGQNMRAGTVLGTYSGIAEDRSSPYISFAESVETNGTDYYFCGADATKMGNHLRFVEHGPANIIAHPVLHNGVNKTLYALITDVEKGDDLFVDYGGTYYPLSFGAQKLYRKEETRQLFKEHGFEKMVACSAATSTSKASANKSLDKYTLEDHTAQLENWRIGSPPIYVLNSPAAMLDLHFSGIVDIGLWYKAMAKREHTVVRTWMDKYPTPSFYRSYLIEQVRMIENEIKGDARGYPLFQKWVLDHLESTSLMNLTKAMEWIKAEIKAQNYDFASTIEERLKTYNWKEDSTNMYSYPNRKAQLDSMYSLMASGNADDTTKSLVAIKKQLIQQKIDEETAKKIGFEGSELQKMLTEIRDETSDMDILNLLTKVMSTSIDD